MRDECVDRIEREDDCLEISVNTNVAKIVKSEEVDEYGLGSLVDNVNVRDSVDTTETAVNLSYVDYFENLKSTVHASTGSPFQFTTGGLFFDYILFGNVLTVFSSNGIESVDFSTRCSHFLTIVPTNNMKVSLRKRGPQQCGRNEGLIGRFFLTPRRDLGVCRNFKN